MCRIVCEQKGRFNVWVQLKTEGGTHPGEPDVYIHGLMNIVQGLKVKHSSAGHFTRCPVFVSADIFPGSFTLHDNGRPTAEQEGRMGGRTSAHSKPAQLRLTHPDSFNNFDFQAQCVNFYNRVTIK